MQDLLYLWVFYYDIWKNKNVFLNSVFSHYGWIFKVARYCLESRFNGIVMSMKINVNYEKVDLTFTWDSDIPRAYANFARSGPARYFVCSNVFSRANICCPENVGLVCFFLPSISMPPPWARIPKNKIENHFKCCRL